MANTKKLITKEDLDEIFAEKDGLTVQEKLKLALQNQYITDLRKAIKKAIEEKNK